MNRSQSLERRWTVTIVLMAAALLSAATTRGAPRPNVIVILTDDQGYADMSCHGNPYLQTPQIDRLAGDSVRLTNFHVDPTCSPTRSALLTGRYSTRTGVWLTYGGRHHLRRGERTMANFFAAAGYRTAVFGKWHLGDNYPFRPQDRGFDESLVHAGGVVGETPDFWGNDNFDDTYLHNGVRQQVKGFCTDIWFDWARRCIAAEDDRPFFIYLPTNIPHGPCNVPWKYVRPFAQRPEIDDKTAHYFGGIVNIDENLGRLRRSLADRRIADNTLIVYLTDNGGTLGVHLYNAGMRGRKAQVYEGGHRAACFLHWPGGGLRAGRDVNRLTAHFDLLPTLIELCGLPNPRSVTFDGRSLVPLLRGSTEPWPARTLLVHHQGRFGRKTENDAPIKYKDFAVMTERWRLVGDQLFDLPADPGQRRDVSAAHRQVVRRLRAAYESWWDDVTRRCHEFCPTIIDPAHQAEVTLTAQDWHGPVIPYSQQHVRAGVQANGFWDLDVAVPGTYQVTLRRWPAELGLPISAAVPPPSLDPRRYDTTQRLYQLPSRTIAARQAKLKIGTQQWSRPIAPDTAAVRFEVQLPRGPLQLQTWLVDTEGHEWGAYYVTICPVSPGHPCEEARRARS